MGVKIERKEFNKKIKQIKKLGQLKFETGIFNPESARKGIALDEGVSSNQVARPWFSNNMKPESKELRQTVKQGILDIYNKKMTPEQLAKKLTEYCKTGLDDSSLAALKQITLLYKSGKLKRPDTKRKRKSKDAPERIGVDSGKMIKDIKTVVTKGGRK